MPVNWKPFESFKEYEKVLKNMKTYVELEDQIQN